MDLINNNLRNELENEFTLKVTNEKIYNFYKCKVVGVDPAQNFKKNYPKNY